MGSFLDSALPACVKILYPQVICDMRIAGLLICTERNSSSGFKKILLFPKGLKHLFYSTTSSKHIKNGKQPRVSTLTGNCF